MTDVAVPEGALCQCPACSNGGAHPVGKIWDDGRYVDYVSLDPDAGGTFNDKPIWDLNTIAENLNRTGYDWYTSNYKELDDGVLNFGFWQNFSELANSYYVNATSTIAFGEADSTIFSAFSDAQQAVTRTSIGLWDDLISISFRETKSADADLNYGNTDTGGAQAYAYLPFGDSLDNRYERKFDFQEIGRLGGDVWIDGFVPSNFFPLQDSFYSVLTMIHETGHALGLSHPGDYDALDDNDGDGVPDPITYANDAAFAQDTLQYSVMSYFDAYETGAQHIDWSLTNFAYAATPLVHDIASIQAIYGVDTTTRTGDTVYGFNSTADRAAYDFSLNTRPIVAIWDAGGNDTIDFSGWNTPSVIDLNEGAFSSGGGTMKFATLDEVNANRAALGFAPRTQATYDFYVGLREQLGLTNGLFTDNVSIAYGVTVENAVGGGGNDLIVANNVANMIDGGAGLDIVSYETATEAVTVRIGERVAGGAAGDTLISVEGAIGSAFADKLIGDAGDNSFEGGGGDDRMTGGAGRDLFVFHADDGAIGSDRINDFSAGDVIAVDRLLRDSDGGDVVQGNENGTFVLDRSDGDRVTLLKVDPAGLDFLGRQDDMFYYGYLTEAPVAASGQAVFVGTAADNVIAGSADDSATDIFFFDTASPAPTGDDKVTFTNNDLFVTTTALIPTRSDGLIYEADALFELPRGTAEFSNPNGFVNTFEFDGSVTRDGVTYYVYSLMNSAVGIDDLTFAATPAI